MFVNLDIVGKKLYDGKKKKRTRKLRINLVLLFKHGFRRKLTEEL